MKIYLIGILKILNIWKVTHIFRQDKLYLTRILIINVTFQLETPTGWLSIKVMVRYEEL